MLWVFGKKKSGDERVLKCAFSDLENSGIDIEKTGENL